MASTGLKTVNQWVDYLNTKADSESTKVRGIRKGMRNAYSNGDDRIILPNVTETEITLPTKESKGKTNTAKILDGKVYNKYHIKMKVVYSGNALD